MKAGFKHVCDFMMEGDVSGAGKVHNLLLKKFDPNVSIIKATINDYTRIQNMARFMFMIYQETVDQFHLIGLFRKMAFMSALILKAILKNRPEKLI
ncbi:MAG UNVERIFIED_CONTAM: hypothetical protein LVQ98_06450 [Rickettsiaceae bacterium]|jgi:hypothetical protein